MQEFTNIVIGAGIEGSATAYSLAKNGQKTLLLEQFPLPHSRGSSHGQSRIIRRSYASLFFSQLMDSAYEKWHQLERETSVQLLQKTGYILMEGAPYQELNETASTLRKIGAKFELMTSAETRQRFSMPYCPDGYHSLYEPEGGALKADKCLLAYQNMFVKLGGTIHDNEKVVDIVPGKTVTVYTNKATYQAPAIVITAGPWASKLTRPLGLNLPLQPIRINVCYWKTKTDAYSADKGQPVFAVLLSSNSKLLPDGSTACVYGCPEMEYPGHIKVCLHAGHNIDPEERDSINDSWDVTRLKTTVRDFFPEAEPVPSIQETCIYTNTPDVAFILDTHPKWQNIVIGAGFSGTGFKLAPVIGQILADMALGRRPSYDVDPFRMDRFPNVMSPSSSSKL